tara:strand:+ start:163 stop:540 length:378 start_codon:yes stop_codon:yes gene_type:complete
MKVTYNPKLKQLARKLRNDSTRAEIKLWKELQNKQVYGYKFTRQKPIGNYIADFFCNKLKLVIEVDGYSHNFEDTLDKDLEKEQFFNSLTITILRFDDKEVMEDLNNVLKVIEGYILSFEKLHTP